MDKALINSEIAMHQKRIGELEAELAAFDDLLENNQYDDHNDAEGHIRKRYRSIAGEACEGSYCYGDSEYTQAILAALAANDFAAVGQIYAIARANTIARRVSIELTGKSA